MPFTRLGYGQVEPNQLSGIKTGQIFASLPLDSRTIAGGALADTKVDLLQNGEFMFYDYEELIFQNDLKSQHEYYKFYLQ